MNCVARMTKDCQPKSKPWLTNHSKPWQTNHSKPGQTSHSDLLNKEDKASVEVVATGEKKDKLNKKKFDSSNMKEFEAEEMHKDSSENKTQRTTNLPNSTDAMESVLIC